MVIKIKRITVLLLFIAITIPLLYYSSKLVMKNAVVQGGLFYIAYLFLFMVIVMVITIIYKFAWKKGHPIFGIGSLMAKHIKFKEGETTKIGNMAITYEQIILRIDGLLPISLIFGIITYIMINPYITTISYTMGYLVIGIMDGIFVMSYILYSLFFSILFYLNIKRLDAKGVVLTPDEMIEAVDEGIGYLVNK